MNSKLWLLMTLLVISLAACAPSAAQPAEGQASAPRFRIQAPRDDLPEVRIVAHEFEFSPMAVRVPANQPFTLVLDNSEALVEHDVDVPALGGLHIHAMARSEARTTLVITAAPGNYAFGCTLPGHRAAGMRGTITVDAS
jgi:plastocyanin